MCQSTREKRAMVRRTGSRGWKRWNSWSAPNGSPPLNWKGRWSWTVNCDSHFTGFWTHLPVMHYSHSQSHLQWGHRELRSDFPLCPLQAPGLTGEFQALPISMLLPLLSSHPWILSVTFASRQNPLPMHRKGCPLSYINIKSIAQEGLLILWGIMMYKAPSPNNTPH